MREKPTPRIKGWRAVLVIALALGATLLVWNSRRPKPLDGAASALLDAMLLGDGGDILDYAFEEEVDSNDLDSRKLSRLYRELIIPRLNSLPRTTDFVVTKNEGQGVAEFEVKTKFGQTLPMAATVYTTGDGPKGTVLRALYGAWCYEYFNAHDETFSQLSGKKAVLAGLRKDRHLLADIGITKLTELNVMEGTVAMTDIDDLESRLVTEIRQLELAHGTGTP